MDLGSSTLGALLRPSFLGSSYLRMPPHLSSVSHTHMPSLSYAHLSHTNTDLQCLSNTNSNTYLPSLPNSYAHMSSMSNTNTDLSDLSKLVVRGYRLL